MATTSIWRVKGYINKVLMYAQNPEKTANAEVIPVPEHLNKNAMEDVIAYASRESATNQRQLVWGINCSPETARNDMLRVKRAWQKEDGTIAYHGYQSFREGEVTPEIAHEIGIKLAQELWGDRYQVLVCTHLDKSSHLHNHFVVNTVSFVDGIKYHRTKEDYQKMREVSDRLCREYGLSVIRHPQGKGKHYSEWQAEQEGKSTHRWQIRGDIDKAIQASLTSEEFYQALMAMGYDLKFYAKSGKELDRPSLRPRGSERFFRFDRLGEGYSVEEIDNRILDNYRRKDPFPEETRKKVLRYRQEHPKHTKAKGLAALYYYYCYELGIIKKFPASAGSMSAKKWKDLRKLDQLDAQTRLLAENGIETVDDLHRYQEDIQQKIEQWKGKRQDYRNELKRHLRVQNRDQAAETQVKIAEASKELERLRNSLKLCEDIEARSAGLQQEYEERTNTEGNEKKSEERLHREVQESESEIAH